MKSAIQCIAFILDGNRRWAKEHGLPKLLGHKRGFDVLKKAVTWVRDRGIPHMAVYAFSTENWNREKEEVEYLMEIFRGLADKEFSELAKEGARIRFIGKLEMLPMDLQELIQNVEKNNISDPKITLWVCMSYGSRAEIVAAAKAAAESGEEVTEENLHKHFWSAQMPDPDLVVRTGGEERLSNFLLWQAAYSELFFIEPHWPDFSETILDQVLEEYAGRQRRHGK